MREIKFRAWDKKTSRIYQVNHIDNLSNSNEICVWTNEIEGGYHFNQSSLEQYTGLHDKNGREIYDGDIVKLHVVILSPDDKVGVIEYRPEFGYCINFRKSIARQEYWAGNDKHTIEVIGNIHENPELMEGK
ncbi:hypothetical protein R54839_PPFHFPJH_00980 [Fructobacillus fructosus]|uniref:YopX protein domain-containing protein n=1 Tax=Fructobacillus fructosus TaxID=1631 RepID=A0ABN9YT36_9LACO|nr:hypothetical protein R54839_PPFHFPJH_00980 [Fructobacillus fructosus]